MATRGRSISEIVLREERRKKTAALQRLRMHAPKFRQFKNGWVEYHGRPLTPRQWKAVTAPPNGPVQVIAGPGSGKTRVLVRRFLWLVEKHGIDPSRILLLTLTNKEAKTMFGRIRKLLGKEAAILMPHRGAANGGTIHSWCSRGVLRSHGPDFGFPANYTILDGAAALSTLKKRCRALNLNEEVADNIKRIEVEWAKARTNFDAPLPALKRALTRMHEDWSGKKKTSGGKYPSFSMLWPDIVRLVKAFEATKKGDNTLDFTDLIVEGYALVRAKGALRQRLRSTYSHILIDEAQDLSRKQLAIVKAFAGEKANVMAVCDPYQTLFRFSGAWMGNMLNFRKRFPSRHRIVLNRNFRSTQRILDAAKGVIEPMTAYSFTDDYLAGLISNTRAGERPWLVTATDVEEEAAWVVSQIKDLLAKKLKRRIEPKQIAVIGRNWEHLAAVADLLAKNDIPYDPPDLQSRSSRQPPPEPLPLTILRLAANRNDSRSLAFLLAHIDGVGAGTSRTIMEDTPAKCDIVRRVRRMQGLRLRPNVRLRLDELLDAIDHVTSLHTRPRAAIDTAVALAHSIDHREDGDDFIGIAQRLRRAIFAQAHLRDVLEAFDLEMAQQEKEGNAVALAVPHTAKSRQWRHVFIVRTAVTGFPDTRNEEEDERRALYVSMTRAKVGLYLVYPRQVPFVRNGWRVQDEKSLSPYIEPIRARFQEVGATADLGDRLKGVADIRPSR